MQHLMGKGVTWSCVYNVNSWCTYLSKTHTCFHQEDAPEGEHHDLALDHRAKELSFYETTRPNAKLKRKIQDRLEAWQQAREALLKAVMPQRLILCKYYKDYECLSRESSLNPIDKEIPRLIALKELSTSSFPV